MLNEFIYDTLEPGYIDSLRSGILSNLAARHYSNLAYQEYNRIYYDGVDPMDFKVNLDHWYRLRETGTKSPWRWHPSAGI